jgi:hypothetical protein
MAKIAPGSGLLQHSAATGSFLRGATVIALAATCVIGGCGEDSDSPGGSGTGGAGGSSAAAGNDGGSATDGSSATSGSAGQAGSAGSSGGTGASGGMAGAGGAGTGGGGGTGGDGGPGCSCPPTPPADRAACDAMCAGRDCAYEDCDGAGLVVASCRQEAWSVITSTCGSQRCGPAGSQAQTFCSDGFVCIQQSGGALFPEECRTHECGSGPITCDCLGASCPGQCTQAAPLYFLCNTCPSGLCP